MRRACMRPIKFRGRRLDNREWIYGSLVIFHDWEGNRRVQIVNDAGCIYEVNSATVGQYWRRINGKELFEGDIFRFKVGDEYIVRTVRYSEEQAAFCIINPSQLKYERWTEIEQTPDASWWQKFVKDIEIIGNIHDNPELLKGGE